MIDLREKLNETGKHLENFLSAPRDRGKSLGILFYHTHPNYGQSHLYLGEDESVGPEEELLGENIDDVIDYEGWTDSTGWREGELPDEKLELIRLSGERLRIVDNDQFNVIWAEDIESLVRKSCLTMDPVLVPKRIVVCAESGEYRADWYTRPD